MRQASELGGKYREELARMAGRVAFDLEGESLSRDVAFKIVDVLHAAIAAVYEPQIRVAFAYLQQRDEARAERDALQARLDALEAGRTEP